MAPTPREIRLARDRRSLDVDFGPAGKFAFPAEFLRVHSPSAEVQGHGPNERRIVSGQRDVTIVRIERVGRYAIRLSFADGHDTGLYSWDLLLTLGLEQDALWQAYLEALRIQGLSRGREGP